MCHIPIPSPLSQRTKQMANPSLTSNYPLTQYLTSLLFSLNTPSTPLYNSSNNYNTSHPQYPLIQSINKLLSLYSLTYPIIHTINPHTLTSLLSLTHTPTNYPSILSLIHTLTHSITQHPKPSHPYSLLHPLT